MLNKTILQGRLVRDVELRQTQSGVDVASFTVAWSEKYKDVETQCFLPCTAWRGTAKFIHTYFQKGSEIVVEGSLKTRKWEDKDGNNRSVTELTVDKAHFCGSKQSGPGGSGIAGHGDGITDPTASDLFGDELSEFEPVSDGELPF